MEKLQTQVEVLEQTRAKWLFLNLIGFCIWDGLRIIENYLLERTNPVITGIMIFGWLIWIISLIQILRLGKEMKKNKQLLQILNDELIELNRFKTWRIALFAVGLTQVFIIILTSFVTEISGLFASELSIFIIVVFCIGGFLYFNIETSNA